MKKIMYSLSLFVVMLVSSFAFSACKELKPVELTVKDNTIETTIVVSPEKQLDLSNLIVIVKYEDGTTKEFAKNEQMTFNLEDIDLSVIGEKTLTINYLGLKVDIVINVIDTDTFIITYHLNGGTNHADNIKTYKEATALTQLKPATKKGYEFVGWFTQNEGGEKVEEVAGGAKKNLDLYARFNAIEYTITYNANNGTHTNPTTYTIETEDIELLPAEKEGFKFLQWEDAEGNKVTKIAKGSVGDIVLTAKYQAYTVADFSNPAFVTAHNDYKTTNNEDDLKTPIDESIDNYVIQDNTFKVGDDNKFVFLPNIRLIDTEGNDIKLNKYSSIVKVELKDGESYTELLDEALTNLVAVDNQNSTFDFTESAIGKQFKITVSPELDPTKKLSFEVEIVDGWNVYTPADLSRLSNVTGKNDYWVEYKTANNVGYEKINSLVFQNDIALTVNDIPKKNYYAEGDIDTTPEIKGSLKDRLSIYVLDIPVAETFTIYGNYFTLDYSQLPLIKHFAENTSHAALIDVAGDNWNSQQKEQGTFVVDSLRMVGNANRSNDENLKGGINGFLLAGKKFQMENSIVKRNFTVAIILHTDSNIAEQENIYNNSKFYDSFNGLFFAWDSKVNKFTNCVLKHSGGPLVMSTCVDPGKNLNRYSNYEFVNCELSGNVEGTEGWFAINNATGIAGVVKSLNTVFDNLSNQLLPIEINNIVEGTSPEDKQYILPLGNKLVQNKKGFLKVEDNKERFNLIATVTSDKYVTETNPIAGSIVIKDADGKVISDLNMTKQVFAMPIFESNGIRMATDQKTLFLFEQDEKNNPITTNIMDFLVAYQQQPMSPTQETIDGLTKIQQFFAGQYLSLYQPNSVLGATVEFYNLP